MTAKKKNVIQILSVEVALPFFISNLNSKSGWKIPAATLNSIIIHSKSGFNVYFGRFITHLTTRWTAIVSTGGDVADRVNRDVRTSGTWSGPWTGPLRHETPGGESTCAPVGARTSRSRSQRDMDRKKSLRVNHRSRMQQNPPMVCFVHCFVLGSEM